MVDRWIPDLLDLSLVLLGVLLLSEDTQVETQSNNKELEPILYELDLSLKEIQVS